MTAVASSMNPATFALVLGIVYTALGVLGFIPTMLAPAPPDAPALRIGALYGLLFGAFPVNALLSAVHLALGLWGFAAWSGSTSSLAYARALAVISGVLALMGLIPGLQTVFGLMPVYGHDVWQNAVVAAIAAYFAVQPQIIASRVERRRAVGDRRHGLQPVAYERRHSAGERRILA